MSLRVRRPIVGLVVLLAAAGLIGIGRLSAGIGRTGSSSQDIGAAYLRGLRVGIAQGLEDGRALQEGSSVTADRRQDVTQAFRDGYAAGANDVFDGYDGGWAQGHPYVVILERGEGSITYRIASRLAIPAQTDVYLCSGAGSVCQRPHH